MKRSELKRKTPLRSTSTLARAPFKPPTRQLDQIGRLAAKPLRQRKPKSAKLKARNAGPDYLAMCRGQRCYLQIPGVCTNDRETVVPCHSNQAKHGKGMGIKALDIFTVPGCACCHRELDQGMRFTRAIKFFLWDSAYQNWQVDRKIQFRVE